MLINTRSSYRVLQFIAVFLTIRHLWGYHFICLAMVHVWTFQYASPSSGDASCDRGSSCTILSQRISTLSQPGIKLCTLIGLLSHAVHIHWCRSQHMYVLTTCTFMSRQQVCTIEPSFFKMTGWLTVSSWITTAPAVHKGARSWGGVLHSLRSSSVLPSENRLWVALLPPIPACLLNQYLKKACLHCMIPLWMLSLSHTHSDWLI